MIPEVQSVDTSKVHKAQRIKSNHTMYGIDAQILGYARYGIYCGSCQQWVKHCKLYPRGQELPQKHAILPDPTNLSQRY
jgi:hypothetical protein